MDNENDLSGAGVPDIDTFLNVTESIKEAPLGVTVHENNGVQGVSDLPPEDKIRLLNPMNPIKIIGDGVETVTKMSVLNDSIASRKTVSFHDAEEVNLVFEAFKTAFRTESFTQQPSLTNLKPLQRFTAQQLRIRQECVVTDFQTYMLKPLGELEDLLQSLEDHLHQAVLQELRGFIEELGPCLLKKSFVADQEFLHGTDTQNLATTPLKDLPTLESVSRPNYALFVKAVKNLCDTLCSDDMECIYYYNKSFAESAPEPCDLSLFDLLKTFNEGRVEDLLVLTKQNAEEKLEKLRELVSSFDGKPSEFKDIQAFVVKNSETIAECVAEVKDAVNLHHFTRYMVTNLSVVMDFFKN